MTKTDKDYNLEFEESTKYRDKLKNKKQSLAAKAIIKSINTSIALYNKTIAKIPRVKKLEPLDPNQTLEEIAEKGGGSFSLGVIDDSVKFIRRVVIPGIQSGGMSTG